MENFVSTKATATLYITLLDFPANNGQVVTQFSCVCVCVHSIQIRERVHVTNKSAINQLFDSNSVLTQIVA